MPKAEEVKQKALQMGSTKRTATKPISPNKKYQVLVGGYLEQMEQQEINGITIPRALFVLVNFF